MIIEFKISLHIDMCVLFLTKDTKKNAENILRSIIFTFKSSKKIIFLSSIFLSIKKT